MRYMQIEFFQIKDLIIVIYLFEYWHQYNKIYNFVFGILKLPN